MKLPHIPTQAQTAITTITPVALGAIAFAVGVLKAINHLASPPKLPVPRRDANGRPPGIRAYPGRRAPFLPK